MTQADPLSVKCPVCGVAKRRPCSGTHGFHSQRYTQAEAHPAKAVACECGAQVGALCVNMRDHKSLNVHFHDARDRLAYVTKVGEAITGLTYPNGGVVRRPWVTADRLREVDNLHSLKIRRPGVMGLEYWVSSFDQKIWYGHLYKSSSQRLAIKARESIVDAVALLDSHGHTIWDEVAENQDSRYTGRHGLEDDEDPGEAPFAWGDCDHAPCTGH